MGFPNSVKNRVLIDCRRHCVLCGKFCGTHIELHHIKQHADGGKDTYENCIPLCFDCHADVKTYNTHHPVGTKYTEVELINRRDIFYREIQEGKKVVIDEEIAAHFEEMLVILQHLFRVETDEIGAIKGYKKYPFSYSDLRKKIINSTPENVDHIVKWLTEHRCVETNIRKDAKGEIGGSIKITKEGIEFFYQCKA